MHVNNQRYLDFVRNTLNPSNDKFLLRENFNWNGLFRFAEQQALLGIVFEGIKKIGEQGIKPPFGILMEWIARAEQISQRNKQLNLAARRYTELFEKESHQSVILKGQANARLYPNPLARQPGDIDIYVDGGKETVQNLLRKHNLIGDNLSEYLIDGATAVNDHHFDVKDGDGIEVEVHFRASTGNMNPFTNKRYQKFIESEVLNHRQLVNQGFYVPRIKFALVMQLSHIQHHFLTEGIGLRQLIDYYYLLKSDVYRERDEIKGLLKKFGLAHMAGAIMWLLHNKLGLEKQYLICNPDEGRGLMLLSVVMEGGNFGRFGLNGKRTRWSDFFKLHLWRLNLLRFNPSEVIWGELHFLYFFFKSIPARISHRSWSLGVR